MQKRHIIANNVYFQNCPPPALLFATMNNNPLPLCADPPQSTEHCDWLYGIFGHETSCTRYWTCWNGTATEQFCIGGLLYNEETHACDWPQNVAGCQKHRKFIYIFFTP